MKKSNRNSDSTVSNYNKTKFGKSIKKGVIVLAILSMLFSLLGCSEKRNHSVQDIVLISSSNYGTARNPIYSFVLKKYEGRWLLSASCYVGKVSDHYTSFSSYEIEEKDAQIFLTLVSEEKEVKRLQKYREPKQIFEVMDGYTSSSAVYFSDGSKIVKNTELSDKLIDNFYELASKYYQDAEGEMINEVSIHSNCMDNTYSYFYSIEYQDDMWIFEYDAFIDDETFGERKDIHLDLQEAQEILAIVEKDQLVNQVKNYKNEEDDDLIILDETTYNVVFNFVNGKRICAPIEPSEELREAFYQLAKKYSKE